jgi:hypothetical protein
MSSELGTRPWKWRLPLLVAVIVTLAVRIEETAKAQTPAGPERLVNSVLEGPQAPWSVACTTQSVCALLWSYGIPTDHEVDGSIDWLMGRVVTPLGRPGVERELRFDDGVSGQLMVEHQDGFVLLWNRNIATENHFATAIQELDALLLPRGPLVEWQGRPARFWGIHAVLPLVDGYALLWLEYDSSLEETDCDGCAIEVFLTLLNGDGTVRHQERVNDRPFELQEDVGFRGSLAMDGEGRLIVVYSQEFEPANDDTNVFARRFSPEGVPLGPPIQVNTYTSGTQWNAQVAAAPSGEFTIVWQSEGQDGDLDAIVGRRFGADGLPRGREFLVNDVTLSAQRWPQLAMNERGDLAVVWQSFDPAFYHEFIALWDVKLRVFRADCRPVTGEIRVNQERHNDQTGPYVAFAPNGTLLVGWSSANQPLGDFTGEDVYARTFAASPGDEICWLADGLLRCDLGRTGGRPELRRRVEWIRPGDVPLLGDFDGDGRADLCAWRAGLLRCDLDHEGIPLEGQFAFGQDGDIPLLGNVDGDTRADPCVRRGGRLLCDPDRDGQLEVMLVRGNGTETPLLGDVDGDGRDDLCLYQAGVWRCHTWAGKRLRFDLGAPGAIPALGDFDGDGRSDPCVLEGSRLLCDAARNGRPSELVLELPPSGTVQLLLGNLDGLHSQRNRSVGLGFARR